MLAANYNTSWQHSVTKEKLIIDPKEIKSLKFFAETHFSDIYPWIWDAC